MSFIIPENAPFSGPQRMWLKGFLDGISSMLPSSGGSAPAAVAEVSKLGLPVTILWGSQTGSAEGFAKKLSKKLGSSGHSATVIDMANATVEQLSSIENLLVITSTYGDGEPPDNAVGFHGALHASDVSLANIHYAVFALGDSNYPEFCKCGHDFDKRLTALGATPMLSIIESDVDHDGPFAEWSKKLESALSSRLATH